MKPYLFLRGKRQRLPVMRMLWHCLAFVSMLLIHSCKKDATVKLPEIPAKLVVICFLSPQDSLIKVSVTLSQPLYNTAPDQTLSVQNAHVVISSTLGSTILSYDAAMESYVTDSLQLKIREGIIYTVVVSTPDGKIASATTSVPSANTSLSFVSTADATVANQYKVRATWNDPPGTEDFYRLMLQYSSYTVFSGTMMGGSFSDTIKTVAIQPLLVNDQGNDGSLLTKTMSFKNEPGDTSFIYLLHVSKEYYEYTERLSVAMVTGNPFSEPAQMYTNITNGFGVFAGYNSYRLRVLP